MSRDEWGRPIRKKSAIDIVAQEAYPSKKKDFQDFTVNELELLVGKQYKKYESKVEAKIIKFNGLITRKTALYMLYIEVKEKKESVKPDCQCNNILYCKTHGVIK